MRESVSRKTELFYTRPTEPERARPVGDSQLHDTQQLEMK